MLNGTLGGRERLFLRVRKVETTEAVKIGILTKISEGTHKIKGYEV